MSYLKYKHLLSICQLVHSYTVTKCFELQASFTFIISNPQSNIAYFHDNMCPQKANK